jgi:hypothetical protein
LDREFSGTSLAARATSLVGRMGYLARNRITMRSIIAGVTVCGLAFRFIGLGRSIWLDEAWVANSVTAGSLAGMFYYPSWLQTSPPLFLVLVRGTVHSCGLSNSVLRLIPLLFGVLAAVSMFILSRRVLLPRYALPAWTMFVLSPLAIRYSKELKQYSSELAATTTILLVCIMYLEHPTSRRFWVLLGTTTAGLLIAYSVAFALPGIILVVCLRPIQFGFAQPVSTIRKWSGLTRGLIFAAVAGGILIGVYFLFALPNNSSDLRSFYAHHAQNRGTSSLVRMVVYDAEGLLKILPFPDRMLQRKELVSAVIGPLLLVGFALACLRFRRGRHRWLEVQAICAIPCFLLSICSALSWYPRVDRTSLFVLPALVLLLMGNLQLVAHFAINRFRRDWLRPLLDVALVCVTLLMVERALANNPISALNMPAEDVAAAVSFLRSNVQRGDILWVHASCSESFKLYAKMTSWSDAPARFGHTGWPCCPRGIHVMGSATKGDVSNDLDRGIPSNFSGRVWLLYTERIVHWRFVGIDEPQIMDAFFRAKGCLQKPTPLFHNMGVSSFDCKSNGEQHKAR